MTTRRAPVAGLSRAEKRVAGDFAAARLLTEAGDPNTGAATVELAHEALLSSWPRLRTLAEHRAPFLRWREEQFEPWFRTGELLEATKLAAAEEWIDEYTAGFTERERTFVTHSSAAARQRRRLARAIRVAFAALALVATTLMVVAIILAARARQETA